MLLQVQQVVSTAQLDITTRTATPRLRVTKTATFASLWIPMLLLTHASAMEY